MEKKNLMRKLYEQVRAYDDLLDIPDTVKYSGNTSIQNLLKDVEEFNRLSNDKNSLKECKRLFNNAMRTLAEILDAHEALNYDYKLQLKKKQYVIDGLKKFIDDRDDLDAEIPSDDDEEEASDEKELKKGLSRRELSIMKSLNKQSLLFISLGVNKTMKKYTDNPLNVRLHQYQENKLNEMLNNENYCIKKGIYSKSDAVRSSLNNIIKDYEMTTLGTR